jgi:adenylate cyclase
MDPSPDVWLTFARTLIGEPEFTPAEVAERAGVSLDLARRLWRALGFPPVPDDQRAFTLSDVQMLRAAAELMAKGLAAPDIIVRMARVVGQAAARVAGAQVAMPAAGEASVSGAAAIDSLSPALVGVLEGFLSYCWRRHLLAAAWRQASIGESLGTEPHVTVGFADMVGFTAFSRQLDDRDLADVVDRFEARVYEHVPERGGRVVKMIGDEVMFVADHAAGGAEIALGLVEAHAADSALPNLRVGLATGPVLTWEGDLFGPTVNLASRLVDAARPGTVLVAPATALELESLPGFDLRRMHRVAAKGFGRVRVSRLRRASPR